jgi:hypothetical protein
VTLEKVGRLEQVPGFRGSGVLFPGSGVPRFRGSVPGFRGSCRGVIWSGICQLCQESVRAYASTGKPPYRNIFKMLYVSFEMKNWKMISFRID